MIAKERKRKKRKEAEARQEIRNGRTDCVQLSILSDRRGESARERKRLEARIVASEKSKMVVEKPDNINRAVMSKKMQKRRKGKVAKQNGK